MFGDITSPDGRHENDSKTDDRRRAPIQRPESSGLFRYTPHLVPEKERIRNKKSLKF